MRVNRPVAPWRRVLGIGIGSVAFASGLISMIVGMALTNSTNHTYPDSEWLGLFALGLPIAALVVGLTVAIFGVSFLLCRNTWLAGFGVMFGLLYSPFLGWNAADAINVLGDDSGEAAHQTELVRVSRGRGGHVIVRSWRGGGETVRIRGGVVGTGAWNLEPGSFVTVRTKAGHLDAEYVLSVRPLGQ